MGKSLIIVESPAKIKTLKQFLGSGFVFESSYGHVRDLPGKEFGVDIENDFEPKYVTMPDKKEVIAKLKKSAKECDIVYLSPDPDREGEAIAWHISQILPEGTKIKRVAFNSITKDAVREALQHPSDIDMALVNAQQARRLLDRIVGYSISPPLNKRLRRGRDKAVSAGRVQSVALKIVVDREREIQAFVPQEYWNISALLDTKNHERSFKANLYSVDNIRVEKEKVANKEEGKDFVLIKDQESAEKIAADLQKAKYKITRVEKKERKRNPEAPFITSTLQQEASRHFRFSPNRTMQIAQTLYEGIDLGKEGAEGLITYMRTDSVRLSPEAIGQVRDYILKEYGEQYLPESPRSYQQKKSAQDAHEAIRPTNLHHHPDFVREFLSDDQYKLYSLIWKRFVACQMTQAIYDTCSVDIQADTRYLLRATGSVIKFNGFLVLYEEKQDEDEEKEEDKMLPPLSEGDLANLKELFREQAFTRPPPRFTEASLVKELEKSGIGRPSTYAAIMNKIQSRDYTEKEQGRLKPTELGFIITDMMEQSFKDIVNIGFTRDMEDELELVAENQKEWKNLLSEFWAKFNPTMQTAENEAFVPRVETDHICPKCGNKLQKIWFKSKYFLGCANYPTCDYTTSLEEATFDKNEYAEDFNWEQRCPNCQAEMKLRFGKFGPFLGCTNYPDCKGIVNIPKKGESVEEEEKTSCPAVGCTGTLAKRRSRFGKTFYSCSEFPACDVIGNSVDAILEKYAARPKTAYEKKTNQKRRPNMATTTKAAKPAAKKPAVKKAVKKAPAKKVATASKPAAKKTVAKKPAVKKATVAKKAAPKKVAAKKPAVKKAAAKKPAASKASAKK
jgi:DNA topoisomerase I